MLSKLKCRGFRATSLSTYDFSTLYTTLPHNLIKEKTSRFDRVDLHKGIKNYGSLYLACNDRKAFCTSSDQVGIHFGHVRMCATPYPRVIPLRIGAWNVRTLMDSAGSDRPQRRTALVGRELGRYDIQIAALSETRFADVGEIK